MWLSLIHIYTNAIFGFLNILLSLLKECEPDEVAVAFDLKAPTLSLIHISFSNSPRLSAISRSAASSSR